MKKQVFRDSKHIFHGIPETDGKLLPLIERKVKLCHLKK